MFAASILNRQMFFCKEGFFHKQQYKQTIAYTGSVIENMIHI